MNNSRFRALHYIMLCITTQLAAHDYVDPPEVVVRSADSTVGEDQSYFYRKLNRTGIVEVRNANNLNIVWKVKLTDFHQNFSDVRLTRNGQTIIHIRGNQLVDSLDDHCVHIHNKDGSKISYRASDIMKKLHKNNKNWDSTHEWIVKHHEICILGDMALQVPIPDNKYALFQLHKKSAQVLLSSKK